MADFNVRKVTVSKDKLPPINSEEEKYVVRYRIISEDRNRISHWSPQYLVSPLPIDLSVSEDEDRSNIGITTSDSLVVAKWNISDWAQLEFEKNPSLALSSYDVYVGWGENTSSTEPVQYFATVSGNYITIPKDLTKASVRVAVQTMTYPRSYSPRVAIADSGVVEL